jgi:hypothetical protein
MENSLRSRVGLLQKKLECSVEEISGAFGKDLYYTDGAAAQYDFVIVIGTMTRIFVSEKTRKILRIYGEDTYDDIIREWIASIS